MIIDIITTEYVILKVQFWAGFNLTSLRRAFCLHCKQSHAKLQKKNIFIHFSNF